MHVVHIVHVLCMYRRAVSRVPFFALPAGSTQSLLNDFSPHERKFNTELEKSLNQFERLNGIHKGQLLPPQGDEIS
jgi:hypothetical protein